MKSLTITTLLVLVLMAHNHETAAHRRQTTNNKQRDLCSELTDFFNLIPRSKFNSITCEHYATDTQFIHAMRYTKTANFRNIIEQLEDSTSYKKILNYLAKAGVDINQLGSLWTNVQNLLKPIQNYQQSSNHNSRGRSLLTYSNEIANTISKQEFYDMVQQKIKQNSQFAKFYAAVRRSSFRTTVLNALNGRDVASPLRTLRLNGIDVRQEVLLFFKVISWGPRVYSG